jgi:hypothetical protein
MAQSHLVVPFTLVATPEDVAIEATCAIVTAIPDQQLHSQTTPQTQMQMSMADRWLLYDALMLQNKYLITVHRLHYEAEVSVFPFKLVRPVPPGSAWRLARPELEGLSVLRQLGGI